MDDAAGAGRGIIFPMPQQIPGLLFPPPSPTPPQPMSYISAYSSPASRHPGASITSLPILLLTVLGILTAAALLLTYYVLVIRCCLRWHGPAHASSLSSDAALAAPAPRRRSRSRTTADASSTGLPVTGVPAEPPPRGLEDSAIRALPTFRYGKAAKGGAAAGECAVCLSEFEEGERVRMLPGCLHAFHVECIDAWLQGNANCPLCRAAIGAHCLLPVEQHDEVVIQMAAGAEEEEEDAQAREQQREGTTVAAAECAGEDTTTADHQQVSGEKSKVSNAGRERVAARNDGDVLPPLERSLSMCSLGGGGEVHLQIQKILDRNTHLHGHGDDSSSSSSREI